MSKAEAFIFGILMLFMFSCLFYFLIIGNMKAFFLVLFGTVIGIIGFGLIAANPIPEY